MSLDRGVGELVVSAGVGGVRVWNVRSLDEVLRVELPGLVCCCCCVTTTLHTIVTGTVTHKRNCHTSTGVASNTLLSGGSVKHLFYISSVTHIFVEGSTTLLYRASVTHITVMR